MSEKLQIMHSGDRSLGVQGTGFLFCSHNILILNELN